MLSWTGSQSSSGQWRRELPYFTNPRALTPVKRVFDITTDLQRPSVEKNKRIVKSTRAAGDDNGEFLTGKTQQMSKIETLSEILQIWPGQSKARAHSHNYCRDGQLIDIDLFGHNIEEASSRQLDHYQNHRNYSSYCRLARRGLEQKSI